MVKEMYTYEEVGQIPLKYLFRLADYIKPKQKELIARQQNAKLESELTGTKPKGR